MSTHSAAAFSLQARSTLPSTVQPWITGPGSTPEPSCPVTRLVLQTGLRDTVLKLLCVVFLPLKYSDKLIFFHFIHLQRDEWHLCHWHSWPAVRLLSITLAPYTLPVGSVYVQSLFYPAVMDVRHGHSMGYANGPHRYFTFRGRQNWNVGIVDVAMHEICNCRGFKSVKKR